MKNLAVLVSGSGTNMQSIIDACARGEINGAVRVVISSNEEAYAIVRAKACGIPVHVCSLSAFGGDRIARDGEILRLLKQYNIDYVILAGYLGIMTGSIIDNYPYRIVNIHPALLPKFGGKDYYGLKVHKAVIAAGEQVSGATAHFVSREIDGGLIIRQWQLQVNKGDNAESLQKRILEKIEHPLLISVVKDLCDDKIVVENGVVKDNGGTKG